MRAICAAVAAGLLLVILAPAPDGMVWAKENGRWGLLYPLAEG